MATLRSGPFLVPTQTCSGRPVTHMFLTFTNLTTRTLTVVHRTDSAFVAGAPPAPVFPPSPIMNPLYPPNPCTLAPRSAAMIAVPVFFALTTEEAATPDQPTGPQQVLVVTVSGDIDFIGDQIQVSVTGGFSLNGISLTESEPAMFIKHENFVLVSSSDLLDEDDESSSSS
ncbi:hypothetical protein [Bacillus sp. UNC438CL73TsuS30]|uniref:hypothetical protein n=1 Tax=Bacillus sp. UNC438CL73TsuS30 TaxID=1340434 RepID=UPI0004796777|nr:hypothetical protein [Bacillus sp. UNC438CL73TsuS30]